MRKPSPVFVFFFFFPTGCGLLSTDSKEEGKLRYSAAAHVTDGLADLNSEETIIWVEHFLSSMTIEKEASSYSVHLRWRQKRRLLA